MYAVIETGGTQFRVEEGAQVKVPLMDGSAGDSVTIDKVLLVSNDKEPVVGKPYIDNATVEAELLGHGKADKVLVYKYKRRTKFRRTNGHRQQFTELKITKINSPA